VSRVGVEYVIGIASQLEVWPILRVWRLWVCGRRRHRQDLWHTHRDGLLRHLYQLHPQALSRVRYQNQYIPLAKRSRNAIPSLDPQVHSIIIRTGNHYLRAGKALSCFKIYGSDQRGRIELMDQWVYGLIS
jgi:hypothetical protein